MRGYGGDRWDLVIFDCDGVLVDSESISCRTFVGMLAELGVVMSAEEAAARFFGSPSPDYRVIVAEILGDRTPPTFFTELRQRSQAAYRTELRLVPGVLEALERITIPMCVASGGSHEKLQLTLGMTGLLARFEGRIFSAREVPRGKPAPDVFLHAAERMGVAPARCAVVEDSCVGVQAGVAAGMTVFAYAALASPAALTAAGAHVFRDMRALPALLGLTGTDSA